MGVEIKERQEICKVFERMSGKIEMRARDSIEKLFENFPDETASFVKEGNTRKSGAENET